MKIKKGDKVTVLSGADKGKSGQVLVVFREMDKAIVEGVNMRKKHQKATRKGQAGQVVEKATPIHLSNLAHLDSKTNKPTRVRIEERQGKRVRVSVKSGAEI